MYCVIATARRPRLTRVPAGLPGAGPVRLLEVETGLFAAVADLPLDRYSQTAINAGLANLDWVSRVAVAHETVVESFVNASAVLPMTLFTIFTTDQRALDHVRAQRQRIVALVKRLANHQEWGIRVVLDRRLAAAVSKQKAAARAGTGAAYLAHKQAQRDASRELASRARDTVAALFDRLAAKSGDAKRRGATELPLRGGPLLLDAAFLVPRSRAATFKAFAGRESKALAHQGYGLTISGPWPPYTFVQD
ncbi:MAG: GvpL/GvpF family gas vesicle protein [Vicinamibacterales bacterium]